MQWLKKSLNRSLSLSLDSKKRCKQESVQSFYSDPTEAPSRGFTLIELLVVISIISLLSSAVLSSLSGTRESAREVSILSSLDNANTQATLYYNQNGSYDGLCNDDKIQDIIDSLKSTGDGAACFVQSGYVPDELASRDYGIGVKDGDTYFAGSPAGSGTFADKDAGNQSWNSAQQSCSNTDKRLPRPLALRAIFEIENNTPEGFSSDYDGYWSSLEPPSDTSRAYTTEFGFQGVVFDSNKSDSRLVRCLH